MTERADVLILTALKDELDAVLRVTQDGPMWRREHDGRGFRFFVKEFVRENGAPFRVALARATEMGETVAAATAVRLVTELQPKVLAMCGICAGARGEVALGDVIVADRIFKFDGGLLRTSTEGTEFRVEVSHDLRTYNLNPLWRQQAEDMAAEWAEERTSAPRPLTLEAQERWLLDRVAEQRKGTQPGPLIERLKKQRLEHCPNWADVIQRLRKQGLLEPRGLRATEVGRAEAADERLRFPDGRPQVPVRVHVGAVGTSARLQRDGRLFGELRRLVRKTIGVEMEGAALGAVAELELVTAIMVKSVVDFGDEEKDDNFRVYGAENAASFLMAFLRRNLPVREEGAEPTRHAHGPGVRTSVEGEKAVDNVPSSTGASPLEPEPRAQARPHHEKACRWYVVLPQSAYRGGAQALEKAIATTFGDDKISLNSLKEVPTILEARSRERTYMQLLADLRQRRIRNPQLSRIQYVVRAEGSDAADPNEGRFGRLPQRNGRLLWASVRQISTKWYEVQIEVTSSSDAAPLEGTVELHLHPTFPETVLHVPVKKGRAATSVECYGAFVLGALADSKKTQLELNLANLPGIPRAFLDE